MKWLFGGINGGGVIGACVGLPLGVSVVFIDVNSIRPAFYEAIAGAIPVLLLAVVLLIRGEGNAIDQLEEPRRDRRVEAEASLREAQRQAAELEHFQKRPTGDDGGAERTERLQERVQQLERRLHRQTERLAVRASLTPILGVLYISFIMGVTGEVAALAALGSGQSSLTTYLLTGFGVGGLLMFLVILERNAVTRASKHRRIEDELEKEFALQRQGEKAA